MYLEDTNTLITGAGKGIGRAIALRLAEQGSRIIVTGHKLKNARSTRDEIRDRGGEALAHEMDVIDSGQIQRVVEETEEEVGRIDVLINNAGVSTMNPVLELSEEEWDHNMDVNAKGVFLCSQIVARHMVKQAKRNPRETNGKIINIASIAARIGAPLLAHYAASKWAVLGFTRSMAKELAEHKITVNAVCPGFVKTSMQDREVEWEGELTGRTPEEVRQSYVDETPLGRLEQPEDTADLVLFLASDLSDFLTGQAINSGGGVRMD